MTTPPAKKAKTNEQDKVVDDEGNVIHSIFPVPENPSLAKMLYGVAYEKIVNSCMFGLGPGRFYLWNRRGYVTKEELVGEYELYYIEFDAYARRHYQNHQQEQLLVYEDESLQLHRTVQGSLSIHFDSNGKLTGTVKYDNHQGCLVPSNGSFSFVEQPKPDCVLAASYSIAYNVQEKFRVKRQVSQNFTGPKGLISVVELDGALGLHYGDDYSKMHMCQKNSEDMLRCIFDGHEGWEGHMRNTARVKAKEWMRTYDNTANSSSYWICKHLKIPPEIARIVHSFLLPKPFVMIKKGDLVLRTHWDDRSNATVTMARRIT